MNYNGQTGWMLKNRIVEHRGYISNQDSSTATGDHFNLPGHSVSDLTVTVLEQVKKNDQLYREEKEHFFIRKFNCFYNGMNRQK